MNKSPLEVIYDELLATQDLDLVFRWIETHGFQYEKKHLKDMYLSGYHDGIYAPYPAADDTYHKEYPTVAAKIYKP